MSTRALGSGYRLFVCRAAIAAIQLILLIPEASRGAAVSFDRDCNDNWFQTCQQNGQPRTNWDNDAIPGPGDDVTIGALVGPAVAGAQPDININSLTAPGGLRIGDGTELLLFAASAVNGLTWFRTSVYTTAALVLSGASELGPSATVTGMQTGRVRNVGSLAVTASGNNLEIELVNEGTVDQRGSLTLGTGRIVNSAMWNLHQNNSGVARNNSFEPADSRFVNGAMLRNLDGNSSINVVFESNEPATIEVQKGALTINGGASFGGPISIAPGAILVAQPPAVAAAHVFHGEVMLTGGGTMRLDGDVGLRHRIEGMLVNLLNGPPESPGALSLDNVDAEIAAGGILQNRGRLVWGTPSQPGGTLAGAGMLLNERDARIHVGSSSARLAVKFQNSGTVSQTANLAVADASIANAAGARWDMGRLTTILNQGTGASRIDNRGTFATGENDGLSSIQVPLDMAGDGKLEVAQGSALGLTGGGFWSSSTPLVVRGSAELSGPTNPPEVRDFVIRRTAAFAPLIPPSSGVVEILERARLMIGDPLDPEEGGVRLTNREHVELRLRGGAVVGLGTLVNAGRIAAIQGRLGIEGLPLAIDNRREVAILQAVEINGSLLNSGSSSEKLPANLFFEDGARLTMISGQENSVIENRGVATFFGSSNLDGAGTLVNQSEGRITKTADDSFGGGGTATIDVALNNRGHVLVAQGTLRLAGAVVQNQNGTLIGGRWTVFNNGRLLIDDTMIDTIGPGAQVFLARDYPSSPFAALRRVEGMLDIGDHYTSGEAVEVQGAGQLRVLDSKTFKPVRLINGPNGSFVATQRSGGGGQGRGTGAGAAPAPVEPFVNFDVEDDLFLNEGEVIPGGVEAFGSFGINGDYSQTATGTLRLDVGPSEHDQLHVTGTATLDGTLVVELLDGYVPQASDIIVAVTAGAVSGQFANATERVFMSAGAFDVHYTATEVVLSGFDPEATPPTSTPSASTPTPEGTVTALTEQPVTASPTPTRTPTPAPCAGDCNGDGRISIDELISGVNILLESAELEVCPSFDADEDGSVTVDEIVAVLQAALNGCD
jgi:hypothetical protein